MKKTLLAIVALCVTSACFAQDFLVQVGVFDRQVPAYQFADLNSKVYHTVDGNNFHRYYAGDYTEAEAKAQKTALAAKGYRTSVWNKSDFTTGPACCSVPRPKEITASLRSIFFDFDSYGLRQTSKNRLNQLAKTLKENPSYRTKLLAHTDAKGTNSYNETLSLNRANAARNYLVAKGISRSRIDTQTYGEANPIAKNELAGGQDTEEGRQLNRRVEILLLNSNGEIMNAVEDIVVPDALKG